MRLLNLDAGSATASRPVDGLVNEVLLEIRVRRMAGISSLKADTSPGNTFAVLPVTLADDLEVLTVDDPEDATATCLEATLFALETMGGTSVFTVLVRKCSLL